MGCDIHCCLEVKLGDTWHLYSQPDVDRNYRLFARMAGVRGYYDWSPKPIALPRGVPDDMSALTKALWARFGSDGHSHSYLTKEEMSLLIEELKASDDADIFGWLLGDYCTVESQKDNNSPFNDWRLVFWFDN